MIDKELAVIAIDQMIQSLGTLKAALGEQKTQSPEAQDEKNTLLGDAMDAVETYEAEIIPAKETKKRGRKPKEGTPVGVVDQPEAAKEQNIEVVKADEANQMDMFDSLLPEVKTEVPVVTPEAKAQVFTESEVRQKIVAYAQKHGAQNAYGLISKFGSSKLDGLTKAKMNELGSHLVEAGF